MVRMLYSNSHLQYKLVQVKDNHLQLRVRHVYLLQVLMDIVKVEHLDYQFLILNMDILKKEQVLLLLQVLEMQEIRIPILVMLMEIRVQV